MRKVVHYDLPQAKLAEVPAVPEIKTASNGVRYMDVPGKGFYAGTHKGIPYNRRNIKSLETTFAKPTEELRGSIPVMIDHSFSNRDKVGHLRTVFTQDGESMVTLRLVGDDAIKGYMEGKYHTLSAGIAFDDSDGEGYAAKHSYEGECPECGAEMDDSDDNTCPKCGCEVNDDCEEYKRSPASDSDQPDDGEEQDDQDFDSFDDSEEMAADDMPGVSCTVSYDHIAFTPFPALTHCKTYKRSLKTVEKKTNAKDQEMSELAKYAKQLEAERDAALHAKDEAETKADAKFAALSTIEENIRAGRVLPSERDGLVCFMAEQPTEDARTYFSNFLKGLPSRVSFGVIGEQKAVKPEDNKPLQSTDGGVDPATKGRELLLKYSQAGAHAAQREKLLAQANDAADLALLKGIK